MLRTLSICLYFLIGFLFIFTITIFQFEYQNEPMIITIFIVLICWILYLSIFIMLVYNVEDNAVNDESGQYQSVSQVVEDDNYPEPVQNSIGLVIEDYFAQEKEI
jgi:hypothetical protein